MNCIAFDCIAFHDACTDGAMAAIIAIVALWPRPQTAKMRTKSK